MGVFAPNSQYRTEVTPAKRGKGRIHQETKGGLSPPLELLPDSRALPSSDWFT
jgi:hypothetical protein